MAPERDKPNLTRGRLKQFWNHRFQVCLPTTIIRGIFVGGSNTMNSFDDVFFVSEKRLRLHRKR